MTPNSSDLPRTIMTSKSEPPSTAPTGLPSSIHFTGTFPSPHVQMQKTDEVPQYYSLDEVLKVPIFTLQKNFRFLR
ncbi:hypothetical protein NL676_019802 [Syzygium grande]|nr:hypothetical protein NL676_019802 [Syzygium grande]